ncbi:MAG TPA: phosphate ABC transporter permease subunit PstC, partial [Firmicutes bacterium]|nr:phosphate ABC transporter permease subunit PstC [Bacillota bacterium]
TSSALGVSKWYMVTELILPASRKSILVSMALAIGRAMGETMAVMMVIGNSTKFPTLLGKAQTIPALIALEMGMVEVNSLHYHALYAAGLVLMLLLFAINAIIMSVKQKVLE